MAIVHDGPVRLAVDATGYCRRSQLGPAVFEVSDAALPRVLDWAGWQPVPSRGSRRSAHHPSVDGWAMLDGGIVHAFGYGLTSLTAGGYLIGFRTLHLVLAELGLALPDDLVLPVRV